MVATRDVGDAAASALLASDWTGVAVRKRVVGMAPGSARRVPEPT